MLKKLFIFIVVLVVVAVCVLGYYGFVPGVSNLFGSNSPRNLGVVYEQKDVDAIRSRLGITYTPLSSETSVEGGIVASPSGYFKGSLTEKEVVALMADHSKLWKYYPFSDVQVKFNSDGTAEASGVLRIDRLEGCAQAMGIANNSLFKEGMEYARNIAKFSGNPPFYIKGKVDVTNGAYTGGVETFEVGRVRVPLQKFGDDKAIMNLAKDALRTVGVVVREAHMKEGELGVDVRIPTNVRVLSE